jgi:predicted RNase H-like HicB family nuclease
MSRDITVQARWDGEAGVWIATSPDVPGLVVEADTWPAMIEEVRIVLPELLEVSGALAENLSITFKAEEHLDLAGA